jgi:HEPN domain-containing protein
MRLETAEWVEKAEADFHTASREAAVTTFTNHDAVCFHAQQCAEKYLKALLVEANVPFPRTHDLLALLALTTPSWPGTVVLQTRLSRLARYSVTIRYPGDQATSKEASTALEDCEACRGALRAELQLPL